MNMNIVAVIQARMGSERLPGKTLMDIEGKPMLWHVVSRLARAKNINKIVVAATNGKEDDVIENFCKENSIDFYRGDRYDVLDRYYRVSVLHKADAVVRITGDCPLIDPKVTGEVVEAYLKNIDVCAGASNVIKRSYPRGLDTEIFSQAILEKAWKEAKDKYYREHVTTYFYSNPGIFKLYSKENDRDLSGFRWTVDEKEDLEFVRQVYSRLYKEKNIFYTQDILNILDKNPDFMNINSSIKQKTNVMGQ